MVSFTPLPLYPRGKILGACRIGCWVDSGASLGDVEERKFLTLPGLELRALGRPAHSQSLYRLRYPGSLKVICVMFKEKLKKVDDIKIIILLLYVPDCFRFLLSSGVSLT